MGAESPRSNAKWRLAMLGYLMMSCPVLHVRNYAKILPFVTSWGLDSCFLKYIPGQGFQYRIVSALSGISYERNVADQNWLEQCQCFRFIFADYVLSLPCKAGGMNNRLMVYSLFLALFLLFIISIYVCDWNMMGGQYVILQCLTPRNCDDFDSFQLLVIVWPKFCVNKSTSGGEALYDQVPILREYGQSGN